MVISLLVVIIVSIALIGYLVFLIKRICFDGDDYYDPDEDSLPDTGNIMIATQIKRDILEIREEVEKLIDSTIKLNSLSKETLEKLREQTKGEPVNSPEYKMLVNQILKELQQFRNTHTDKDCECLIGRAIRVLSQLTF